MNNSGSSSRSSSGEIQRIVPRIVIDARMVFPQAHGIGRYVTNLAYGLAELARKRGLGYKPVFLTDPRFSGLLPSEFETIPVQAAFLNPKELTEIPARLKHCGASLYHSPSFSSLAYSPCPWIVTIHDLNHLQFGNTKQKIYYRVLLKRFAKKARSVLTVSEFARRELSDWLKFSQDRIDIVYNAIESSFTQPLQALADADRAEFQALSQQKGWDVRSGEFLICLSNSKPHKNLPFLVDAHRKASGGKKLKLLVSVGAGELGVSTNDQVVLTSHLGDREARLVLAHARAAVYPSLYEGFGLGPLETLMRGTPAFVSDIAPHREGLRDFVGTSSTEDAWVKWLNPTDTKAWSEALTTLPLACPEEMRVGSSFLSARNAAMERYSVKRLAEHMDRVYAGVLGVKS